MYKTIKQSIINMVLITVGSVMSAMLLFTCKEASNGSVTSMALMF